MFSFSYLFDRHARQLSVNRARYDQATEKSRDSVNITSTNNDIPLSVPRGTMECG